MQVSRCRGVGAEVVQMSAEVQRFRSAEVLLDGGSTIIANADLDLVVLVVSNFVYVLLNQQSA